LLVVNNLLFKNDFLNLDINLLESKKNQIVSIVDKNKFHNKILFKIISGTEKKYSGSIFLDDILFKKHENKNNKIFFIDQVKSIFDDLTILDNLYIVNQKLNKNIVKDRLELIKEIVPEIFKLKNKKIRCLNEPEKMMLSLARIILMKPELVILLEPTLGFCPASVDKILSLIKYIKELNISFFSFINKLDHALKISDWIYVLDNGEIFLQGDSDSIIKFKTKID
jgi:ABC-type branched-subunit amino acid transport system ATPase component